MGEISTITDQLGGNEEKVAQHLYVEDADLKAQDATAKDIADNAGIDRAVKALRGEATTVASTAEQLEQLVQQFKLAV